MSRDFSTRWPQLSTLAAIKYPQICESVVQTGLPALVELYGHLFKLATPSKYKCSCNSTAQEILCAGCANSIRNTPKPEEVEVFGPPILPKGAITQNRMNSILNENTL